MATLHTFQNSTNCLNTTSYQPIILSDGAGVRFVQVRMRDCGSGLFNGCSSQTLSLKHTNPF
jgi:hypothetical protein